jgi:modulator of FtsH protease
MQPQTPLMVPGASTTTALAQNRVLRNTYWLLALSLVPTVLGAWIGLASGFNAFVLGKPIVGLVVLLVVGFGFIFAIERYKNSTVGVGLLLGFTFFMGLMLSRLLGQILGFSNGTSLIAMAFGGTAVVFATMATLATTIKRDLAPLGKFLFVGLVMLVIASIANVFLQLPAMMIVLSVIAIGIFSAYMLFDVNRIVTGGETNYVSATLAIYLDIYNVFANLLALLGITGGSND